MLILTLWSICTGRGAGIAVALWLWLRLRDLPIRVLEFIDMVVPHRFVKGYWEPSMKLASRVEYGNLRLLASLAVRDCFEAGLHLVGEHGPEASDVCTFHIGWGSAFRSGYAINASGDEAFDGVFVWTTHLLAEELHASRYDLALDSGHVLEIAPDLFISDMLVDDSRFTYSKDTSEEGVVESVQLAIVYIS